MAEKLSDTSLSLLREAYERGELSKPEYIARMHAEHQLLYAYRDWIAATNIAGIEVVPEGVRICFRTPPVRLWCPLDDQRAAPVEALNFGDYEADVFHVMRALLTVMGDGARTVVDAGANVGYYAIALATLFPALEVHAFEPVVRTAGWLRANLALNDCPTVFVHQCGLSDEEGEFTFHTYPGQSVAASRERILDDVPSEQVTCRLRTLDRVRAESGLRVDFLKCDVEGAERQVFRGAHTTLAEDRPVIATEMLRKWSARYGYHPNDLINDLESFGYTCHAVGNRGIRPCPNVTEATVETNFVFLHAVAHAGLARDSGVLDG